MAKFFVRAVIASTLMINFSLVRSHRLGIVGGVKVGSITEAPYQAAFYFMKAFKCGASIISKECALTAGHCVADYPKNITLRIGSKFKNSGGQILEVTEAILHPNYDHAKLNFDFALLRFRPITFNQVARPIKITNEAFVPEGTECKVSGWGRMENDVKTDELMTVNVYMVSSQTCQQNYNSTRVKFRITDKMLCAGVREGRKDACSGDSGGPLVCNGRLHGDVSSGYGCGVKGFPGIYGRVFTVRSWIESLCSITKDLKLQPGQLSDKQSSED